MDDSGVGRDDAEIVERALAPAQKQIALAVALELEFAIAGEGVIGSERIDLHRMIDHQIDRLERIDPRGIAAEPLDRVAHRGQIGRPPARR